MQPLKVRLTVLVLEVYAITLAVWQYTIGVRTDEAKYLLDIPYPHPPAIRFLLGMSVENFHQELFWRVIFATLLVQAVWLVWIMSARMKRSVRLLTCAAWIFSAAFALQTGAIMMAPLTALQTLLFLYFFHQREQYNGHTIAFLAYLWLISLFTAYQAILLLPIVFMIFHRSALPRRNAYMYAFAPVILLILYTFTNPLALASMISLGGKDIALPMKDRMFAFFSLWAIGGSIAISALGTFGIVLSRRWEVIASFVLVCLYTALSHHDYYAILLTPFFVYGVVIIASRLHRTLVIGSMITTIMINAFFVAHALPVPQNIARDTINMLPVESETLLINGSFGHEWQYYSPFPIVRNNDALISKEADIIVCLETCDESLIAGMTLVDNVPVTAYYRP